jgi:hypothetical protein
MFNVKPCYFIVVGFFEIAAECVLIVRPERVNVEGELLIVKPKLFNAMHEMLHV